MSRQRHGQARAWLRKATGPSSDSRAAELPRDEGVPGRHGAGGGMKKGGLEGVGAIGRYQSDSSGRPDVLEQMRGVPREKVMTYGGQG